jgi:hypothetical protein
MSQTATKLLGIRRGIAAVVLAVVACTALISVLPSSAVAGELLGRNFCANVTLGHLGGPNDYCTSGSWEYNKIERGYSAQHSTCVSTTTDGTKAGVNVSWACSAGGGFEVLHEVNMNAWTKSIIRNNTTADSEVVVGTEWWCQGGPPC